MNPLEKLKEMQKDAQAMNAGLREHFPVRVYVGNATCENAAGAGAVYSELLKIKEEQGLKELYIGQTGCSGRCDKEPIVQVMMEDKIPVKYCEMTPEKIRKVVEQHIQNKKIIKEWSL